MAERYARVIVDVANAEVDRVFDYIVPEGMGRSAYQCKPISQFRKLR